MASSKAFRVLAPARGKAVFSLENAASIGVRSGECPGIKARSLTSLEREELCHEVSNNLPDSSQALGLDPCAAEDGSSFTGEGSPLRMQAAVFPFFKRPT